MKYELNKKNFEFIYIVYEKNRCSDYVDIKIYIKRIKNVVPNRYAQKFLNLINLFFPSSNLISFLRKF